MPEATKFVPDTAQQKASIMKYFPINRKPRTTDRLPNPDELLPPGNEQAQGSDSGAQPMAMD